MDWKYEATNKLKQYKAKCQALESIPLEVQLIDSSMQSIRSAQTDKVVPKSSGSDAEGRLLGLIIKREELQQNLRRARLWVKSVSKALAILDDEERRILERFYIDDKRGAAEDLACELLVDPKTVYYRKDIALWKFTTALYGYVGDCAKSPGKGKVSEI